MPKLHINETIKDGNRKSYSYFGSLFAINHANKYNQISNIVLIQILYLKTLIFRTSQAKLFTPLSFTSYFVMCDY